MSFKNCYEDVARAEAYAKLDFAGTYSLAFRDLPAILGTPSLGARALDFGCGAGRSTRFLRRLGFEVVGVDISPEMLRRATTIDPQCATHKPLATGDEPYRWVNETRIAPWVIYVLQESPLPGRM
jgi:SAM-dependent methyltransferase